MNKRANRWSRRRGDESDESEASSTGDDSESKLNERGHRASEEGRPPQACPKPTVDPLPAVADDELDGVRYLIEQVGLVYYRSCRTVASAINRLKKMAD